MHVDTIIYSVYIYNSSSRGPLFKKTTLANTYYMYVRLSAIIALRKCLHRKVELSFSPEAFTAQVKHIGTPYVCTVYIYIYHER